MRGTRTIHPDADAIAILQPSAAVFERRLDVVHEDLASFSATDARGAIGPVLAREKLVEPQAGIGRTRPQMANCPRSHEAAPCSGDLAG